MTDNKPHTLASALDFIASEIDNTCLDSFLEADSSECRFICETLSITPLQAALFATILEKSGDSTASTREMTYTLKVSKIRFLSFKQEIDELHKKRLIIVRKKRDGGVGYRVSQAVVKAVQNNSPVEPERLDGLSTKTIFSRMHTIFGDLSTGTTSYEIALQEIFDIFNHNLENKFVETAKSFGLNTLRSEEEKLLFFYMLHRNVSFDENEFTIDEFSRLIEGSMGMDEMLFDMMRNGECELQEKGLMEFQCIDGLENHEEFKIPEPVLNQLLADYGQRGAKPKSQIPKDELITPGEIRPKSMFYNDQESRQVAALSDLLSVEKFAQVQERLKEKGLRSGFCCLFYGPAGTGKTETVLQIARQTGREIFFVDMSRIRSKWVGDSEKNIKQVFNTYKALVRSSEITPIILFNEADGLFGKRIEETSSTDKMSNALQNIILQEMESLEGILIATTNLTENFDSAFERRFLYKILFNAPSAGVKAKIWKSMVDEISEEEACRLGAEYSFTGGQIENITRKLDVDYILTGETAGFDKIITLCKEESIRKEKEGKKIGF
jgi:hypothetical protein